MEILKFTKLLFAQISKIVVFVSFAELLELMTDMIFLDQTEKVSLFPKKLSLKSSLKTALAKTTSNWHKEIGKLQGKNLVQIDNQYLL